MQCKIRRTVNRELITVIAIMAIAVMAMALLQPVLPLYLTSIGVVPSVLGLMFSVAMIGMVFGESSGGWVADRVGLKIPMSIGTFVCAPVVLSFIFTRATPTIFLIFLFLWQTKLPS
jgi:MFS family permease